MKQRVAYIIIDGKQFGNEDNCLNISFDVTYMGNSLVPLDAKFTIYNLNEDDIRYITTNTMYFQDRHRSIEFYCGYKNDVHLMFKGEIQRAQPSGKPDIGLEIVAWTSIYSMGKKVKVSANNIKALDLLRNAVSACGMKLNCPVNLQNSPQLQRIISYFTTAGEASAREYLAKAIRDITGNFVVEGQIFISVANDVVSVSWADKTNKKSASAIVDGIAEYIQINSTTGMVGIPEPTASGVNIRVLLDTTLAVGDTITLMSSVLSLYNGNYNIYAINHHGSTREPEFYTDLVCLRTKR